MRWRSALGFLLGRLTRRDFSGVPHEWWHCPRCGERIVGDTPPGGYYPAPGGSALQPASHEERIARCPIHGRSPYNDPQWSWHRRH